MITVKNQRKLWIPLDNTHYIYYIKNIITIIRYLDSIPIRKYSLKHNTNTNRKYTKHL